MAVLRPSGWISSSLLQSACASDATAGITASSSVAPDGQNGVPLESDTGTEPESVEGDGSTSAIDFLDDLKPECPGHCELAHCSQSPRVQPGVEQHAAIDAFSRIGKLTSIQMPWEAPSVSATAAQGPVFAKVVKSRQSITPQQEQRQSTSGQTCVLGSGMSVGRAWQQKMFWSR